jgi:DNA-binding CsgD family transcriptional regulator
MASATQDRVRRDVTALGHRGLDVPGFATGVARALARAVPFDGICILTFDPATLMPNGVVVEDALPAAATVRLTEIEMGEPDVNTFRWLAASGRVAATLGEATGGDLDRSLRHRELKRPHGFGDELRAVLVADSGTWGAITLLREAGAARFTPEDARFIASLSRALAEGVRGAALLGALGDGGPGGGDPARGGLLLLADDNTVQMADEAGAAWLAELREADRPGLPLPSVVAAVASRARAAAAGAGSDAGARVRAPSGRWLVVRGSVLGEGPGARTAVSLEPARSPELAPLIAAAYGLTERERRVTQLVAQGHSTTAIGERLHLSPYTVQDHLKSVFEKLGVSSRGEVVARLFFEHYAPRLLP